MTFIRRQIKRWLEDNSNANNSFQWFFGWWESQLAPKNPQKQKTTHIPLPRNMLQTFCQLTWYTRTRVCSWSENTDFTVHDLSTTARWNRRDSAETTERDSQGNCKLLQLIANWVKRRTAVCWWWLQNQNLESCCYFWLRAHARWFPRPSRKKRMMIVTHNN